MVKTKLLMTDIQQALKGYQDRVNQALAEALPQEREPAARVKAAMAYSVNNGGKRVRAALVYASSEALGCCSDDSCPNHAALDAAACAVELIHAYSLIHDDLPAMDDDPLRRGKPTCHIAYDEATAILAGDALQTLAFQHLAQTPDVDDATRLQLIRALAQASGCHGMVGGQMLDLESENQQLDLASLEQVHGMKTGALIAASITLGAIITRYRKQLSRHFISDEAMNCLTDYGEAIGLAFQVTDDILDVAGTTEDLGKQAGADQQHNKSTYPALLGLDGARQKATDLRDRAYQALDGFPDSAEVLRQLADFIVQRQK